MQLGMLSLEFVCLLQSIIVWNTFFSVLIFACGTHEAE